MAAALGCGKEAASPTPTTGPTELVLASEPPDKPKVVVKPVVEEDPLRPGTVWRGWTTQKGKAPVAILPEKWDVVMTILSRDKDKIEIRTVSVAGEFKRTSRARATIKINQEAGKPLGYELTDPVSLEDGIEGPGAVSWPSKAEGRFFVGDIIKGRWTSYVPAEGVDLHGEFEYKRVDVPKSK